MPILKLSSTFRSYTQGYLEIPVDAPTAGEAMQWLVKQYPALQPHLYNSQGKLRPFVNLFLGETNIKDLQGLNTPLGEADVLRLVPSAAGG